MKGNDAEAKRFMVTNERGQKLHDKATRDLSLSATEKADLEAWYAEMDAAESKLLKLSDTSEALAYMREQVRQMNARMMTAVRAVVELSEQNERLRGEIAVLEERLSQKLEGQAA